MQGAVRVMLVDDHAVVRQGYRHLLEKSGIKVIAEVDSGEDAYRVYSEHQPEVVVMDLSMRGMGGLEALKRIVSRDRNAKVLVFSMHDDAIFPTRALQAGASGYVTKSSAPDVLVEAVFAIANNRKYVSHDIAQEIAMHNINGGDILNSLSSREFEVFNLLAQGRSIDDIAAALCLDYKTIANVQTRLRQKLNVENAAQLMLLAIKLNIIKT
ncbi:response regulator transcription factor [Methylovorus menthalis]|uniref:response regulator n=1 Tax=Methylovorus menthalis TaxID=1002227 RepID=UPI001E5237EE|nr:response regulator transcription factor [Methylovorus menthalis]MCB4812376.1 response regulator transcription factor [Methylovorus menthalis]